MVHLLLAGADPNQKDGCGKTAIDLANQTGDQQIIVLMQRYASTFAPSGRQSTRAEEVEHMHGLFELSRRQRQFSNELRAQEFILYKKASAENYRYVQKDFLNKLENLKAGFWSTYRALG